MLLIRFKLLRNKFFSFSLNWLEFLEWLVWCEKNEPIKLYQLINGNIKEFEDNLYDGTFLCYLLNLISPGALNLDQLSNVKSRTGCLHNIQMFLDGCKRMFNLTENELFQAEALDNENNLISILKTLSIISKIDEIQRKFGHNGFNVIIIENDYDYEGSPYTPAGICIIRTSYHDIMNANVLQNSLPIDIFGEEIEICERINLIREIYVNEKKIVYLLQFLVDDFLKPLSAIINDYDRIVIFINIEKIRNLHTNLFESLNKAIHCNAKRTIRICTVFDEYKNHLIREYVEYFNGINKSREKVEILEKSDHHFKNKLNICRNNSLMGQFSFCDLMGTPFRHIFQYKLLLQQLQKFTINHESKNHVERTLNNMTEICKYLNESQLHKQNIEKIESIKIIKLESLKIVDSSNHFRSANLKDFGHLIKQSDVEVQKFKDKLKMWKERTIFLFDKALFVCKSTGSGAYIYKRILLLNDYVLKEYLPNEIMNENNMKVSKKLNIIHIDDVLQSYIIRFNDIKKKDEWKFDISRTIYQLVPHEYKINNHKFELFNFGNEIVYCSICQKLLLGVFYQGYMCSKCHCVIDSICCLKKVDSKCLKSISSETLINLEVLEDKIWFVDCDCQTANLILKRLPETEKHVFLVRPSSEGNGHTLLIKIGLELKKLRINFAKSKKFLTQEQQFSTLKELIEYYMDHSLRYLDLNVTNLGIPYRTVLPKPLNMAKSLDDYEPNIDISTGIRLKKDKKYWIINKDMENNFWQLYDSSGLIGFAPADYFQEILI